MKLPNGMEFEDIRLDPEGVWYHGDIEITHQRTLKLLHKSIYFDKGKYFLSGEKIPIPIIVDDVAFFVHQLTQKNNKFIISLSDESKEELDISTLDIGSQNQLYCKIKNRSVRAKLDRKVYYELMKYLTEKEGYFGLQIDNLFYPVQSKKQAEELEAQASKKQDKKSAKKNVVKKKPIKKKVSKTKIVKNRATKKSTSKKSVRKKVAKKKSVKQGSQRKKPINKKK